MKKIVFAILVSGFFAACSTCYECTHMVEIEQNGQVSNQEVSEEYCTAIPDEIEQKEQEGFNCSPV